MLDGDQAMTLRHQPVAQKWRNCRLSFRPSIAGRSEMPKPPLDPDVADTAPEATVQMAYDHEHLVPYLRFLDADSEGADWPEVARIVLHIDAGRQPARARRAWESHLAWEKWMTTHGYKELLRGRLK